MKKRLISLLLVLMMSVSLLPASAVMEEITLSGDDLLLLEAGASPTDGVIDPTTEPEGTTADPTEPEGTTADPTEPADPTADPTEPADPTADPTEPADPTADPTEPADPTADPTEPADPTADPTEPADPTADPTEPADPTAEPTEPADPTADPTEPADPTEAPADPDAIDYANDLTFSPSFVEGYVALLFDEVQLYSAEDVRLPLGSLARGVLYAIRRENAGAEGDRLLLAVGTEGGVLQGYLYATSLRPLSPEEEGAYLLENQASALDYEGHVLGTVAFVPEEEEPEETPPAETPAPEETETPGDPEPAAPLPPQGEGYVLIPSGTSVYGSETPDTIIAHLGEGTAYATRWETINDKAMALITFDTDSGVLTGYVDADAIRALTDEETYAFVAAMQGAQAFHGEWPLAALFCMRVVPDVVELPAEDTTPMPEGIGENMQLYEAALLETQWDVIPSQIQSDGTAKSVSGSSRPIGGIAPAALLQQLQILYLDTDVSTMELNKPGTWTIHAVGGDGYYQYKYAIFHQEFTDTTNWFTIIHDGGGYSTSKTATYSPTREGRYLVVFYIMDTAGNNVTYQSPSYETRHTLDIYDTNTVAGKVAWVVSRVTSSAMTDYQKVKALHDWLCTNANYDYTYTYRHADGVLLKGKGICDSYAKAFRMLCLEAGIPCVYVPGTASGGPHAWNMVLVDGQWYHVDCTWDDTGSGIRYTYFLKKDNEISSTHSWDTDWTDGEIDGLFPTGQVVPVISVTFPQSTIAGNVGTSVQMTPTVLPVNAQNKTLIWTSTNPNVAMVSQTGLVTFVGYGTTEIKATSYSMQSATATAYCMNIQAPTAQVTAMPGGMRVSWTGGTGASSYDIYREINGAGGWVYQTSLTANATFYTDTTLPEGATGIYLVRANFRYGNISDFKDAAPVSGKWFYTPGSPTATAVGETNGIRISWNATQYANYYQVYRRTANGAYAYLTAGPNMMTYLDTTAAAGVDYYYLVRALRTVGYTYGDSAEVSARRAQPLRPATVTLTNGPSSVNLSWNAVNGALGYHVYRFVGGTPQIVADIQTTSYQDNSAVEGVTLLYMVRAYRILGGSFDYSDSNFVATDWMRTPGKPVATVSDSRYGLHVSWGFVANAMWYDVYRAPANTGAYQYIGSVIDNKMTDSTVANGGWYDYIVRAVRSVGSSVLFTDSDPVLKGYVSSLATPSIAVASRGGGVNVSWNAIAGAQQYHIYRYTQATGFTLLSVQSYAARSFLDTKVTEGTAYMYLVRAYRTVDGGANFTDSTTLSITWIKKPDQPIGWSTPTASTIQISWTASNHAMYYEIYRAPAGGTFTRVATSQGTLYVDPSTTAGVTYTYLVRAMRKVGNLVSFTDSPIFTGRR